MGREKSSGKLYYGKPHLVYMQCSYAMQNDNMQLQCRPTKSLQVPSVLIVLIACTGYVFCGTLINLGKLNNLDWNRVTIYCPTVQVQPCY